MDPVTYTAVSGTCVCELGAEIDDAFDRKRATLDLVAKRSPVDELRGEKRDVSLEIHVVDGNDARVIQRTGCACLLQESTPPVRV